MFARMNFGERDVLGSATEALVYVDFGKEFRVTKANGEKYMGSLQSRFGCER